jgi:hypothetical protein
VVAGDRLSGEGQHEEAEEKQREAVFPDEAPHGYRCARPTIVYRTIPVTITAR